VVLKTRVVSSVRLHDKRSNVDKLDQQGLFLAPEVDQRRPDPVRHILLSSYHWLNIFEVKQRSTYNEVVVHVTIHSVQDSESH
jgi:hypothetical protein